MFESVPGGITHPPGVEVGVEVGVVVVEVVAVVVVVGSGSHGAALMVPTQATRIINVDQIDFTILLRIRRCMKRC